MRDHNGNIVVYIGQPWVNPEGVLAGSTSDSLLINVPSIPSGIVTSIEKEGFAVSCIPYEGFKKARETISGLLKKEKDYREEEYDKFEIMDFDE